MNNEPTTEETQRIERIAKRWRRHRRRWRLFCFFAFIYGIDIPHYLGLPSCFDPLMLIHIPVLVFLARRVTRRFVKRLEYEDRQLILQYAESDPRFRHLVKVCKIDAAKEYLRPSQQPSHDDSTLLRAATPHENDTPQEQLLRPTDENNLPPRKNLTER